MRGPMFSTISGLSSNVPGLWRFLPGALNHFFGLEYKLSSLSSERTATYSVN